MQNNDAYGSLLDLGGDMFPNSNEATAFRRGVRSGYDLGRREMAQVKELEMKHLRAQLEKLIKACAAPLNVQVRARFVETDLLKTENKDANNQT